MSPIEKDPPGRFREIIRYGEISDMYDVLNALACSLREGNPDMGTVEWYRAIDTYIPGKVPEDTCRMLLDVAGTSRDAQEAAQAKFVYLLLHMKTVLSASERFLGRTEIDEDEVIDVAALRALESMPNIARNNDHRISLLLFGQVSRAVKQFVAKCTGSPYQIVNHEDFFTILKAVRGKLAGRPSGLSKQQICKWAETLSDSYGLGAKTLRRFLRAQQEMYFATETTMDEDDVVEEVFHAIRGETVVGKIESSSKVRERIKVAVLFYFGTTDGKDHTFAETGAELNVSCAWASQMVYKGLSGLRRDRDIGKLRDPFA